MLNLVAAQFKAGCYLAKFEQFLLRPLSVGLAYIFPFPGSPWFLLLCIFSGCSANKLITLCWLENYFLRSKFPPVTSAEVYSTRILIPPWDARNKWQLSLSLSLSLKFSPFLHETSLAGGGSPSDFFSRAAFPSLAFLITLLRLLLREELGRSRRNLVLTKKQINFLSLTCC